MLRKILLFFIIFFNDRLFAYAQKDTVNGNNQLKISFRQLLLQLSTTYFTVVKENQVDLDSSLIHVSHSLSLSRLPLLAEGIDDKEVVGDAQWVNQRQPWVGQKQLNLATGQKYAALSILLGAYFAFEPGNDDNSFNKGMAYLTAGIKACDERTNIRLKLAGERLLGKLFLKRQDLAAADKVFAAVINEFVKTGDKLSAATTYSWWGLYTPVTATSTASRIERTEKALKIFKLLGDKEGQINSLMNDSYLHMLQYSLVEAESLAKQALNLAENIHFPYPHYITGALMSITMFQGKFGDPLTYGIESVERSEMTGDIVGLPYFYGAVAVLYQSEGEREDIAIDWEKKSINSFLIQHEPCYMSLNDMVGDLLFFGRKAAALEIIQKVTQQVPPVTTLDNLFYNLTIGLYNTYTGQWQSAHNFFNKAAMLEKELEKHGLDVRKPTILYNIANLYYKEGNYKQAKLYYNQYLSQPSIINGGFFSNKSGAFDALIKIDSLAGDYKAQLNDYRQFVDLTVRNYTVSKIKLAEELQVKYATTAKVNQINLLNQAAELEQANLQHANLVKNITVAGSILLIIIVGLLYRQGKIRKKNNDIITRKNGLMQTLLAEKEWLVKEIHHRVKNNLHTIICLLESQAAYLENDALKAIENSQHRIYAMSLIHQKLYQSDDIKVVDMKTYLEEFVRYLCESFGSPENIRVILHTDQVKLGAAQAIPVGLIINEAVNNSFKYAFPKQTSGEIKIEFREMANEIYLCVTDNGIGFKQQADQNLSSLGLELIKGLTLDLRGTVNFETTNGTSIQIRFMADLMDINAKADAAI